MIADPDRPLVVIRCLTFNHAPYIRQCLEGFVMQKTTFRYVAIVHDDCSTDETASIIREYATKYSDIIKPIFETENQWGKPGYPLGKIINNAVNAIGAKYIAFCEGDDYWTDPFKLQKQVDFMDSHPEYSFCCHRFDIYEQNKNSYRKEYSYSFYQEGKDLEITEELFLKTWVTQMLTTIVRANLCKEASIFCHKTYNSSRDVFLFYELLQLGKGISLNQKMGIYRWHDGGIAIGQNLISRYSTAIHVYTSLYIHHSNDKLLLPKIRYNYNRLLRYTNISHDGLILCKEAIAYCETLAQKTCMIVMYLIPPCWLTIPNKIFGYFWRKKCSISNPL